VPDAAIEAADLRALILPTILNPSSSNLTSFQLIPFYIFFLPGKYICIQLNLFVKCLDCLVSVTNRQTKDGWSVDTLSRRRSRSSTGRPGGSLWREILRCPPSGTKGGVLIAVRTPSEVFLGRPSHHKQGSVRQNKTNCRVFYAFTSTSTLRTYALITNIQT